MKRRAWLMVALGPLAGCTSLGQPPPAAALYDLGAPAAQSPARPPAGPVLVLARINATAPLDGTQQWYRLNYADARHLRAYARSRWSAPPAQLVRQRLKARLSRQYLVLDPGLSPALGPAHGLAPRVLRLELEEFAQRFDTPVTSRGRLRLQAVLWQLHEKCERLLSRRSFDLALAAPSPDAAGGAQALAAAVDAVGDALASWLQSPD